MHIQETDLKILFSILFKQKEIQIKNTDLNLDKIIKICRFGRIESFLVDFLDHKTISSNNSLLKTTIKLSQHREMHTLLTFNKGKIIQNLFKEHGIKFSFLKGMYLNNEIYDDLSERPIRDIDILIDRDDLDITIKSLNSIGFQNQEASLSSEDILNTEKYFAPSFINEGVIVDLHLRASMSKHYLECPFTKILLDNNASQSKKINAHLLHLIYHSTVKDNLSNGPIIIKDLAEIINSKNLNTEELLEMSKRCNLNHFLELYILILARNGIISKDYLGFVTTAFSENLYSQFNKLNFYNSANKFLIDLMNKNFSKSFFGAVSKQAISHYSLKPLNDITLKDRLKRYKYLLNKYFLVFFRIIINPKRAYSHYIVAKMINKLTQND